MRNSIPMRHNFQCFEEASIVFCLSQQFHWSCFFGMHRVEIPSAETTDCLQGHIHCQLLHHCSAFDYNGNYSTTLTIAYKIKRWTSPERGHTMPSQDSTLGEQNKQGHRSVKQNCWKITERRWAGRFNSFWCLLIWNQHRNTASFTVLALTAILSWKLNPIFSELLAFWAWICGVHKQTETWQWMGWRISNSHSITQDWRLQAELVRDSWGHEQGCGWRSQVRLLRANKHPDTWNQYTAAQWLFRLRKEIEENLVHPYRPLHSVKLPQAAKYDSIPA